MNTHSVLMTPKKGGDAPIKRRNEELELLRELDRRTKRIETRLCKLAERLNADIYKLD